MSVSCIEPQSLSCSDSLSTERSLTLEEDNFELSLQHVRLLMGGTWKKNKNIKVERITGGLSNHLFKCSLPDDAQCFQYEPRNVLVRIYGDIIREDSNLALSDAVVFALLAEKGIGPKLYGVFPGGRVEEFIESRPLLRTELAHPDISQRVATIVGQLHRLQMPVAKSPTHHFSTMHNYLNQLKDNHENLSERVQVFITSHDLNAEIKWLRSSFFDNQSAFPVVFCHNDLQENNFLYCESSDDPSGFSLMPIDFEYCSYGFRAFDFGNHFNEWCFDYTVSEWPFYSHHPQAFPSRTEQMNFWKVYFRSFGLRDASREADSEDISAERAADLEREMLYGAALSHLFWALWSFVQSHMSNIAFGYIEYGITRMNAYYKLKERLPAFD